MIRSRGSRPEPCLKALAQTGELGLLASSTRSQNLMFVAAVSALLKLLSSLVYQKALQLSPVSLCVPYLAFTPVLLLVTSYFLVNEKPSLQGITGVVVMTCGAYLLNATDSKPSQEKGHERQRAREDCEGGNVNVRSSGLGRVWGRVVVNCGTAIGRLRSEPGSLLMLAVAAIWALTSDFDKLGKEAAPSFLVFITLQRIMMALPLNAYMVFVLPRSYRNIFKAFPMLLLLSVVELYTVIAYLKALDHLFVSYAIAAKRSGILLSVIGGAVFFKESIAERLPYISIMMIGMLLIILQDADTNPHQHHL